MGKSGTERGGDPEMGRGEPRNRGQGRTRDGEGELRTERRQKKERRQEMGLGVGKGDDGVRSSKPQSHPWRQVGDGMLHAGPHTQKRGRDPLDHGPGWGGW